MKGGVVPSPPQSARGLPHTSRAARAAFLSCHSGAMPTPPRNARPDGRLRIEPGMTRRIPMPRFTVPLLLALAGLVLFGQGAYIHAKALLAQVLLERAFAETIASGRVTKPWSWADTWPVARIEVRRLRASAIMLAGSSGQALAFGPGHVELTPNAGERGVAVYSAHRDTHFRFL